MRGFLLLFFYLWRTFLLLFFTYGGPFCYFFFFLEDFSLSGGLFGIYCDLFLAWPHPPPPRKISAGAHDYDHTLVLCSKWSLPEYQPEPERTTQVDICEDSLSYNNGPLVIYIYLKSKHDSFNLRTIFNNGHKDPRNNIHILFFYTELRPCSIKCVM